MKNKSQTLSQKFQEMCNEYQLTWFETVDRGRAVAVGAHVAPKKGDIIRGHAQGRRRATRRHRIQIQRAIEGPLEDSVASPSTRPAPF